MKDVCWEKRGEILGVVMGRATNRKKAMLSMYSRSKRNNRLQVALVDRLAPVSMLPCTDGKVSLMSDIRLFG
jgi:hypothetical protein